MELELSGGGDPRTGRESAESDLSSRPYSLAPSLPRKTRMPEVSDACDAAMQGHLAELIGDGGGRRIDLPAGRRQRR